MTTHMDEMVSSISTGIRENLARLDEFSSVIPTLKAVRALVTNLYSVALSDKGESSWVADQMLQNIYRWLNSASSQLFDPALTRALRRMMKKVLLQMLAEIRRLGAQVVYANFHKVHCQ